MRFSQSLTTSSNNANYALYYVTNNKRIHLRCESFIAQLYPKTTTVPTTMQQRTYCG